MKDNGKTIKELRVKAGYTQKSLAEALDVTDKAVSKWERGICSPDISLVPKLSLLLDADMDLLLSESSEVNEWAGVIDVSNCDFSRIIHDKPLVNYLLVHFLLIGIRKIYVLTDKKNEQFLMSAKFTEMGFNFHFSTPGHENLMVLNYPWFLFGSDLSQQFQGAMMSKRCIKLVPENQKPVFFFIPKKYSDLYAKNRERALEQCTNRTLGRGMICFDMGDNVKQKDVANFVRTYQQNSGLLIGNIEEIAIRQYR